MKKSSENLLLQGSLRIFLSVDELLDAEQTVVFGGALSSGGCTCFDKPGVQGGGQVGDKGILGLAASVGYYCIIAVFPCHSHSIESFGECSYLI